MDQGLVTLEDVKRVERLGENGFISHGGYLCKILNPTSFLTTTCYRVRQLLNEISQKNCWSYESQTLQKFITSSMNMINSQYNCHTPPKCYPDIGIFTLPDHTHEFISLFPQRSSSSKHQPRQV